MRTPQQADLRTCSQITFHSVFHRLDKLRQDARCSRREQIVRLEFCKRRKPPSFQDLQEKTVPVPQELGDSLIDPRPNVQAKEGQSKLTAQLGSSASANFPKDRW